MAKAKPTPSMASVKAKYQKARAKEVVHTEVVDPLNGGRRIVAKSLEHNTLEALFRSGRIDKQQLYAGKRFEVLWHVAQLTHCRSLDYSSPRVDGSRMFGSLSQARQDAHRELAALSKVMGMEGYVTLCAVVGGNSLRSIANGWRVAEASERSLDHYRREVINVVVEALDALATHFSADRIKNRRVGLRVWCKAYDPLLLVDDRGVVLSQ